MMHEGFIPSTWGLDGVLSGLSGQKPDVNTAANGLILSNNSFTGQLPTAFTSG